jgi:predicted transcriptional regulator
MAVESGLEKLFFELASESRLGILRELRKENLKMQEIARRLDVTPTEAFRQLERLSTAKLVQRQPDSSFALAEFGKLVLQISTSLEFISKYRDYFSTHDLMRLPSQFVDRLGELSGAKLGMDTIESLNLGAQAFTEATQYAWGIGEGTIPGQMTSVMDKRVQEGVQIKMLVAQQRTPAGSNLPPMQKNVELRGLSELPAIVVLTEKAAGICFYQTGGKLDYAGFFGSDAVFHDWVRDLFLYYWGKGERASN